MGRKAFPHRHLILLHNLSPASRSPGETCPRLLRRAPTHSAARQIPGTQLPTPWPTRGQLLRPRRNNSNSRPAGDSIGGGPAERATRLWKARTLPGSRWCPMAGRCAHRTVHIGAPWPALRLSHKNLLKRFRDRSSHLSGDLRGHIRAAARPQTSWRAGHRERMAVVAVRAALALSIKSP